MVIHRTLIPIIYVQFIDRLLGEVVVSKATVGYTNLLSSKEEHPRFIFKRPVWVAINKLSTYEKAK
jgi:hypothetical protein